MRKSILSEKNLVVVLFVLVLVIFTLAQEYTKKIEKMYPGTGLSITPVEKNDQHEMAATLTSPETDHANATLR